MNNIPIQKLCENPKDCNLLNQTLNKHCTGDSCKITLKNKINSLPNILDECNKNNNPQSCVDVKLIQYTLKQKCNHDSRCLNELKAIENKHCSTPDCFTNTHNYNHSISDFIAKYKIH